MRTRAKLIGVLLTLAGAANAATPQSELQIQFAQAVSLAAAPGHAEFDAYGRRFELTLRDNDRLLKALPVARKAQLDVSRLVRGSVDNAPGSWVRLARVGSGIEGAIWDGRELYVVTRYANIAEHLTTPLAAAGDQTVVYRLSDTLGGLPKDFCGLSRGLPASKLGEPDALKQYQSIVKELRAAAALAPNDQLEISLVGDTSFQAQMASESTAAMLARLNTVDGIFAEQVHVLIVPVDVRLLPAGNPLTSNDAETLIDQLANYRASTPAVRAPGLAHLMTGRDLDGNTAGIAFIDALCDAHDGVSLSDSLNGSYLSALVMAHELGHNFGARHDGAAGSVCESTPQNYLMSPQLNGSAQFSQCSLDSIAPVVARARGLCIGAASYADVAVQVPASPFTVDTSATFSLPITVRSVGSIAANDVKLEIALPSQLTFQSAVISNGSCNAAGQIVTCTLGSLGAAEDRPVELRLTGTTLGSFNVRAQVSASNDHLTGNDTANVQVGLQSAVDLRVTLAAGASSIFVTDPVEFTVDVSSMRSQSAHGGTLQIDLGGLTIESFVAGAHACALDQLTQSRATCQLADVASGATTRIVVRGRGAWPGYFQVSTYVSVPNDGDYANNYASTNMTVRAEREVITRVSTEDLHAVIGAPYELTYTISSAGRLPVDAVVFNLYAPELGVFESVVASAGTCGNPGAPNLTVCNFGTLAPGAVRTVTVRLHMNTAGTSTASASAVYMNGAQQSYSGTFTWIYSSRRIDASIYFGGPPSMLEGQVRSAAFGVQSVGIDPAQNVVATIDVPAPLRLTKLEIAYSPSGWQCVLVNTQLGRCTGSFTNATSPPSLSMSARYEIVSDVAVETQATLTLTADQDGEPANNTSTTTVQVYPYRDAAISAAVQDKYIPVGALTAVDFTITTGNNSVPGVKFVPGFYAPLYETASVSVNGADCALTDDYINGLNCAIGDLPAHSSVPVTVFFRGLQEGDGTGYVTLWSQNDANRANDTAQFTFSTRQKTDIGLSLAQAAVSGTSGTRMNFPMITVTNGTGVAHDVFIDVPMPGFATIATLSTSAICSGSNIVQCRFESLNPGASGTIAIALDVTAAGTFTSNVTLRSANDSTPGNNARSVAITATAAPPPPAGGGGSNGGGAAGGGGGGRFEWLALSLLALLAANRSRRRRPQPRVMSRH